MSKANEKPFVGFFPLFYNLAEAGRAILIAKRYKEMGGDAIFFSHGGEYEYLAKKIGCKVVKVNPIYTQEYIDLLWKSSRLETLKNPFSKKILIEHIKEEVSAFKDTGVEIIVSTNNFPCIISARVAKLPLISVTPKIIPHFTIYPDDAEFFLTRIIPKSIKLKFLNWYAPRNKLMYVRPFIKLAKKYDIPPPRTSLDLAKGDYTFYTDFPEFIGIDISDISEKEYYIGPIFLDELFSKGKNLEKDEEVEKHLQREGKSILVSLGSSGTKEVFLKILNALNGKDYNVVAVYTSILKEDELPEVSDNILLKKFVPSIKDIYLKVDISIIHGGQGTVYTAAYAGKPIIGIPMQFEQHLNLENMVRHGVSIMLSRKHFKEEKLLRAIKTIFDNYNKYLEKAQNLSKKLPDPKGDRIAAEKIIEVFNKESA